MVLLHSAPTATLLGNFIIVSGSFVTLIILIRVFAWKQLTGIFQARADKIEKDLAKAEEARVQAEEYVKQQEDELKASRLEASQIIGKANARAAHDKEAVLAQAREEAQIIKQKAQADAVQLKAEALESAKEEIASLSIELTEKLLLDKLTASEQSALIDRYLERLGEG